MSGTITLDAVKLAEAVLSAKVPNLDVTTQHASVIVWEEDGIAYAKDGRTGRIIAKGSDHASVLQSALNEKTGRRVVVKGTLTISRTVTVPGNTILDLGEATLKLPDTLTAYSEILQLGGDNVEIEGGTFDGRMSANNQYCVAINCAGYSNITVRNAKFRDILIGVNAVGRKIRVVDCDFLYNVKYCVNNWSGTVDELLVRGCRSESGILLNIDCATMPDYSIVRNIIVSDCIHTGTAEYGIAIASKSTVPVHDLQVANCQFLGTYTLDAFHVEMSYTHGIRVSNSVFNGQFVIGYESYPNYNIEINNVIVQNATRPGNQGMYMCVGDTLKMSNVIVRNIAQNGIIIGGSGVAHLSNVTVLDVSQEADRTYWGMMLYARAVLSNCRVGWTGTVRPSRGIWIGGQYSELYNCIVGGDAFGLYVDADDVKVVGGDYNTGWMGSIYIAGRQRTKVVGAHVQRQPAPYAGVYEAPGSDYTKIIDATFYGVGQDVVLVGANSRNVVL